MATNIHPTAVIAAGAEIDPSAQVGPYSVIGPHVKIGPEVRVASHVVIEGHTTIGARSEIFQFASLGSAPQDKKFRGEPSTLILGEGNVVREYVTLQPGTAHGTMTTTIGANNLFMATSHVAHDCRVGDNNIFANGVVLAGHVTVESNVVLGGLVAVHQFTRVGSFSLIGGGAMVAKDVPPCFIAQGDRAVLRGVNAIGLSRAGFSAEDVSQIRRLYKYLFLGEGTFRARFEALPPQLASNALVQRVVQFIRESKRGICHASESTGEV